MATTSSSRLLPIRRFISRSCEATDDVGDVPAKEEDTAEDLDEDEEGDDEKHDGCDSGCDDGPGSACASRRASKMPSDASQSKGYASRLKSACPSEGSSLDSRLCSRAALRLGGLPVREHGFQAHWTPCIVHLEQAFVAGTTSLPSMSMVGSAPSHLLFACRHARHASGLRLTVVSMTAQSDNVVEAKRDADADEN